MEQPKVSVLTPVYNGAAYLAECIESVLNQSFTNFEYIIVNNCSKDATAEIAESYVRKDSRVRLVNSDTFRPVIANHNYAFSLISPESKYVKVVSADDVIFRDFLAEFVCVVEANPSAGLVSSYRLRGGGDRWGVECTGLPYWVTLTSGKEICRSHLLTGQNLFGAPTTVLYRADLVRSNKEFYPNPRAEADISCCIETLLKSDFGFVHQVLSYERWHESRVTTKSRSLNAYTTSRLFDLKTYGPKCLSATELRQRQKELLTKLYRDLATAALNSRDREFWRYQKDRLEELGMRFDRFRLARAIGAKISGLVFNPGETLQRVFRRFH